MLHDGRHIRRNLHRWAQASGAAAALTLALLPPAPVAAQDGAPADGPVELIVATPLSDEWGSGDQLVVEATVNASALVAGQLTVSIPDSTRTTAEREVEVAGGASERFWLSVPAPPWNQGQVTVVVRLQDGNEVIAEEKLTFRHTGDTDVTGVLPRLRASLADLPAQVSLAGDLRRSKLVTVPAEVIEMGTAALGQLDALVGSSADLAGLSADGRLAVLAWIDLGGKLYVDDDADLSALPPAWRPGDDGYAFAGRGEVRHVAGEASAGKWKEFLLPGEVDQLDTGFGGNEMFVDPRSSLARRAGVRPPTLSPILVGLGIYAVLIGPVLYLVLRSMRRLSLGWFVVPLIALVVAGGVAVTGGEWRRGGRVVANVARQTYPGGAYSWTEALLFSRAGGRVELGLPAGWAPTEASQFFGEDLTSAAQRTVRRQGENVGLGADLEPGQVAVMRAAGAAASAGLEVTAAASGRSTVTGTVHNPSTLAIESVAVFAPGAVVLVGDLAAGETKPFEVDDIDLGALGAQSLADQVWSDPDWGIGRPFDGRNVIIADNLAAPDPAAPSGHPIADFGLWGAFSAQLGPGTYPAGMVRAVGWRFDQPSGLDANGPVPATELISTLAPVGIGDGKLERVSIRAVSIDSPFDANGNGQKAVTLLRLPPGVGTRPLQVLATAERVEFWTGTKWEPVDEKGANKFPVPAPAVIDGAIIVRNDVFFNGPFQNGLATLEEVR